MGLTKLSISDPTGFLRGGEEGITKPDALDFGNPEAVRVSSVWACDAPDFVSGFGEGIQDAGTSEQSTVTRWIPSADWTRPHISSQTVFQRPKGRTGNCRRYEKIHSFLQK